ncbi:MAG: glycosyltransferase, partial [bacterium]|nr:glycosyltransferase [bacterium]
AELPSRSEPPRVTIIIPVYNGAALTEKCLYGIARNSGEGAAAPDYEVVVVDNGSDDWTMYLLHAMEGDLRVLSNDRNLGFARACNQGAAESSADYLLFLNNDTVPHADWLAPMVAAADADPRVGIVGARLLYPDGTVQHAGLHLVNGIPDHEYRGAAADDPRVCKARDLDMVTGACLLIRRDLFESLGGFDAQFVNGVEDVDLCLRARDRGFRVVYCPEAVVDHHEAQSKGRFDHVQENVQKFLAHWQGRFDVAGRLRVDERLHVEAPASATPSSTTARTRPVSGAVRINLEGSFFVHSSLAHVNRELALALIDSGGCDLGLVGFEPDQFEAQQDPRYAALAARMNRPLPAADVHVRHRWPPDLSAVPAGRYALMQPWEFGSVPRAWVEAVRAGVVSQVWAYTNYVRNCYIDGGVDPDRVAIVPPGIDAARFRPGLAAHEIVRTKASFRFLFVGGTLYRKGIDILLRAWREAFSATDDVALVIKDMGVGTFYRNQTAGESIRQLQADPGCAEIQYLTDDLPGAEVPRLYAAADVLVHPYRGEGFGLPVAEAMACGLPVIVTRGGACDDFCPQDIGYGVASRRQPVQLGGGGGCCRPGLATGAGHGRSGDTDAGRF